MILKNNLEKNIQKMHEFVVFILSHGRADNFFTLNTLKKHGYSGPVYIVIDNEDETADKYYKKFGDKVIMFDKTEAAKLFDVGDNFTNKNAIVYARNASYGICERLGYKYFFQFEDDYTDFRYKIDANGKYIHKKDITNLDVILSVLLEYYKSNLNIKCLAFSQGGDFIGGVNGQYAVKTTVMRKTMNSLLCSTERPIEWIGRMNDDVNTYVCNGRRGDLFLGTATIALQQILTQKNKGGHSDIYKGFGTYVKSFYSVMYAPSCVKVAMLNTKHSRLHHQVTWNNTAPRIISDDYKK